jgi:hypothetical protein
MSPEARELTIDDVRERAKVARLTIPENRLDLVRRLLSDALRPIRAMDARAVKTLEPAVTFDAASEKEARHGK